MLTTTNSFVLLEEKNQTVKAIKSKKTQMTSESLLWSKTKDFLLWMKNALMKRT